MDRHVQEKCPVLPEERVIRVFHKDKGKAEVLVSGVGKSKRIFVEKDGQAWKDQFGKKHNLVFPEA